MLKIYEGFTKNLDSKAFRMMLLDRKKVFIDQLGWGLSFTDDGFEIDEYDTEDASYIIICDEYGKHAASMRVISTKNRTMIFDHFPELCVNLKPSQETWEVTRFIAATASQPIRAAARLMYAGYRFAILAGVRRIVSVTGRKTALQMRACGSRPRNLKSIRHHGEEISSCEWEIANGFSNKLIQAAKIDAEEAKFYMETIEMHFSYLKFQHYINNRYSQYNEINKVLDINANHQNLLEQQVASRTDTKGASH